MPRKYIKPSFFYLLLATSLVMALYSLWRLHPYFLSIRHGEEMRDIVRSFVEIQSSVKGNTDPDTISIIAAGDYLEYLLDVRCQTCSRVQVATGIEVVDLEVRVYSENYSKVFARIEFGWHWASPQTAQLEDRCYAQAYDVIYIFERANQYDNWKVTGGEAVNRNAVDDSPELNKKHCDESVGDAPRTQFLTLTEVN